MPPNNYTISISSGTILRVLLFALGVVLVWILRDLVLALLTSVVIASAIEPGARTLERYRIPRVVSVIGLYIACFLLFAGVLTVFVPPLVQQSVRLADQLPEKLQQLSAFSDFGSLDAVATQLGLQLPDTLGNTALYSRIQQFVTSLSGGVINAASSIFGGAFSFILILVLSFYLSVQKTGVEEFIKLVVPVAHEPYALDLWRRSQQKIGKWLQGQLLLGFMMGVFTYLLLAVFGIPYAMVLAAFMVVAELVPIVGPVLAAIPAIVLGFLDSTSTGIAVSVIYIVLNQFENHLLYPLVVKKVVGLPPLLVIIALIIGGQLGGFIGVLLSIPIAASLKELFNDIDRRKHESTTGVNA